jgi:hypothetical protein
MIIGSFVPFVLFNESSRSIGVGGPNHHMHLKGGHAGGGRRLFAVYKAANPLTFEVVFDDLRLARIGEQVNAF